MRGLQASSARFAACPSGLSGASSMHLLPRAVGPGQVLLAERAHDALVQQRLRVLGIDASAIVELRERLVGLVRVVVADAEVGADVDVLRAELERLVVPLDRLVVPLGVEVQVAELDARGRVRRLACRRRSSAPSRGSRPGRRRGPVEPGDPAAPACGSAVAAVGTAAGATPAQIVVACWLPIIQPAIRPKNTPAIPNDD